MDFRDRFAKYLKNTANSLADEDSILYTRQQTEEQQTIVIPTVVNLKDQEADFQKILRDQLQGSRPPPAYNNNNPFLPRVLPPTCPPQTTSQCPIRPGCQPSASSSSSSSSSSCPISDIQRTTINPLPVCSRNVSSDKIPVTSVCTVKEDDSGRRVTECKVTSIDQSEAKEIKKELDGIQKDVQDIQSSTSDLIDDINHAKNETMNVIGKLQDMLKNVYTGSSNSGDS